MSTNQEWQRASSSSEKSYVHGIDTVFLAWIANVQNGSVNEHVLSHIVWVRQMSLHAVQKT
jgi:hypothetical protein